MESLLNSQKSPLICPGAPTPNSISLYSDSHHAGISDSIYCIHSSHYRLCNKAKIKCSCAKCFVLIVSLPRGHANSVAVRSDHGTTCESISLLLWQEACRCEVTVISAPSTGVEQQEHNLEEMHWCRFIIDDPGSLRCVQCCELLLKMMAQHKIRYFEDCW